MSLFWQELKKIWRPGILAGIVLLGLIYYYMFPSFYIEHFSNGPSAQDEFDLSVEWVAQYGPTLEPEERAELDSRLAEEVAIFDRQLEGFPEAAAAGITDYASFRTADQTEENARLAWDIRNGTDCYTISAIQQMLERYDDPRDYLRQHDYFESYTAKEQEQMLVVNSWPRSFLSRSVMDSTDYYFKYLAQWTTISVILLLSPTLVRDRLRRTRSLQWSGRRGRRVLHTQLAAGLVSALLLSVVNVTVYAIPFLAQGPLALKDCPLGNSVWAVGTPWFNWTYGQYLAVLTGMVLALGIGIGAVTLFLSRFSNNYVSMLLKAFPLFVTMGGFFATWVVHYAFFFHAAWDGADFFVSKGAEAVCVTVLLIAGAALTGWSCVKQRKLEC
nr:hypothetical protein [uncultured Acetatifactor sp.]